MKYFSFATFLAVSVFTVSVIGSEITSGGNLLAAIGIVDENAWNGNSQVSQTQAITSTTPVTNTLQDMEGQIQNLAGQVSSLRSLVKVNTLKSQFTKTLKKGDSGKDVTALQRLLSQYPNLFAGGDTSSSVTGYFGSTTKDAIIALQNNAGLEQTGVFDSQTLQALSAYQDSSSPAVTPIDTSPVSSLESQIAQMQYNISDMQASISDLQSRVTELETQAGQTPPAPPPPIVSTNAISNLGAVNIARNTANINWTTSLQSDSEVDYSISSTLASGVTIVTSSTMATSHSLGLKSLTQTTKYYYRVSSRDSSGNTITSSIQSFTTTN